ncbi:MAG: M56 family metallopeptidase, partial [Armatimonadota bacterium]
MNEFFLELIYRSMILAGLGLLVRLALVRSSAQARAATLTVTIGALALLPLAMVLLPELTITVAQHEVFESAATSTLVASEVVAKPFVFPGGLVWMTMAVLLLARLSLSLYRFHRLEQGFAPASASLIERVKGFTLRARGVYFSPLGEPPMTWGFLQPKIALPQESEEWIEPQLRSVVLHEDAHIRRRDWAVMIAFRVIVATYWFNPLVWVLQKFYELDSERAADDLVLSQGVDSAEYAGRLVEVAKTLRGRQSRIPAVTMARSCRLNGRVSAILSSKTRRDMLKGWTKVSVLGILGTGAIGAWMIMPEIKQVRLSARAKTPAPPSQASVLHSVSTNETPGADGDPDTAGISDGDPDFVTNPITTANPGTPKHIVKSPNIKLTYADPHLPTNASPKEKHDRIDVGDIRVDGIDFDPDAMMKEIGKGMEQAKIEIEKATKDSEKDFDSAMKEL